MHDEQQHSKLVAAALGLPSASLHWALRPATPTVDRCQSDMQPASQHMTWLCRLSDGRDASQPQPVTDMPNSRDHTLLTTPNSGQHQELLRRSR